jgi:hypothetical protein
MTDLDVVLRDLVKQDLISRNEGVAIAAALLFATSEENAETFTDRFGTFSFRNAKKLMEVVS